jgi:hypothetical protein
MADFRIVCLPAGNTALTVGNRVEIPEVTDYEMDLMLGKALSGSLRKLAPSESALAGVNYAGGVYGEHAWGSNAGVLFVRQDGRTMLVDSEWAVAHKE